MKIHEFDPVIYPYKLWIIVDKNRSNIADNFKHVDGKRIKNIAKNTKNLAAFVMPVVSKKNPEFGVIICFYSIDCITFEIVAHESSHAAKYLFKHINADINEHEPFEFAVGWIAKCCEEVKNNKLK